MGVMGDDPLWWWCVRLIIAFMYSVLALWKAFSWCRSLDVKATWIKLRRPSRFSSVVPDQEDVTESEAVTNHSYKMQLDGLESEIAYISLTQVIAPFCFFTVVISLGRTLSRDVHERMGSIVFGDTNAIPLLATSFVWFRGIPLGRKMRIWMWLLLAVWFGYSMIVHLERFNWHFAEEVWLNHMVFVTIISIALRLPQVFVVVNTLLHTIFFLSLTSINGSGDFGPSLGSQVLLVSLAFLCINYSQVLSQTVSKKANAEYKLVQAEVCRVKMEKRILNAEQEARTIEANEAKALAELADDKRIVAEANAQMVEKMHDAMQHLLLMLCDAVVELDSELKILDQGKLGLVLYQHQKDLAGRPFRDFLVTEDVERFQEMVQTNHRQRSPVAVTMMGSYSMKIRMTVYLSQIDQADGSCTYVLGICESQEETQPMGRTASARSDFDSDVFPPQAPPPVQPPQEIHYFGAPAEEMTTAAVSSTGTTGSSWKYEAIQPMLEEEKLQSLLPLIWSWPLADRGPGTRERPGSPPNCCETHRLIQEASVLIEKLKGLECQEAPRCLVWQCPGCKLKGVPRDRDSFNASLGVCGRCASWDMLI